MDYSSINTDAIIYGALSGNDELMETIEGRLYGTAIQKPEVEALNEPVPYIVVTFDGLNNDGQDKDDPYEGDYDHVQIGVEVAAEKLDELSDLMQEVRDTIHRYLNANETPIAGYQLSSGPKQYDDLKPCFYAVMRYDCDVENQTAVE